MTIKQRKPPTPRERACVRALLGANQDRIAAQLADATTPPENLWLIGKAYDLAGGHPAPSIDAIRAGS